jgi:hypothetical protein
VTATTTEALEEIGAAMHKIEILTAALAATSSAFEVPLAAIENARIDEISRAAEAELAKVERATEALQ